MRVSGPVGTLSGEESVAVPGHPGVWQGCHSVKNEGGPPGFSKEFSQQLWCWTLIWGRPF